MDGSDVLWDGVSHEQIVEWVSQGPGAALTELMEARLKSTAEALSEVSNAVNSAIQRAGGEWLGGAADAATEAMRVLRSFDDGMHFTSNIGGIRAFGQSDSAGFVRANVPPVVEVKPPNPTGGLVDIINATVDYQQQQAAAKEAEQRARDIMREYDRAASEREAAMTPLTPAPRVVLDIATPPSPPIIERPPRPRDVVESPHEAGPVRGPDGGSGPAQPDPASPSVTRGPTQAAVAPAPVTPGTPGGPAPAAGGLGATVPPPAGGFVNQGPGERSGPRSFGESPGRGGGASGGGRGAGGGPRGGGPAGHGAAVARGTAAGHAAASPFGAGPGARREEDREHQVKYGVPTAEHFEPEDPVLDPHREGWFVAPEVIGDREEEGENR